MFMPTFIRKNELVFGQTDAEFAQAQQELDDFDRDEATATRSLRAWIAPESAQALSMIARAHDVSPTVILGVIIKNGVQSWPGRFDMIEEIEEEGQEEFDLLDRQMFGEEKR